MTGVFSGGLAYEMTQEPNDFGLVEINGTTAQMLGDFIALQSAYKNASTVTQGTAQSVTRLTTCPDQSSFFNINATTSLPDSPATDLIKNGVSSSLYSAGKLITPSTWSTTYTIMDQNGNAISNKAIDSTGFSATNPANGGTGTNGTKSSAGKLRFDPTLVGVFGVGLFAWNGLV